MHLAYLDETGIDGHSSVAMYGCLIVPSGKFGHLSMLHQTAIQQIIPEERLDSFKEFHASQLYKGTEAFEGIDEAKRFTAIQVLLQAVGSHDLSFIYAAVDRKKVVTSGLFTTVKPLTLALPMCLLGIENWARARHSFGLDLNNPIAINWNDTYLCVLDESKDQSLKMEYRNTYRSLRRKMPFVEREKNRLWHAHDDMFFAHSTDCIGIQMADLCNYFVRMHIEETPEPQNFYSMISKHVVCAKPEPEWSQYGHLFRSHKEG